MSAIKVLKDKLEDARYFTCMDNPEEEDEDILAFKEAIVALEQKENDRKQGALEELKRIEEVWHHIGSKGVCNYIEKRIKELEKEDGEK